MIVILQYEGEEPSVYTGVYPTVGVSEICWYDTNIENFRYVPFVKKDFNNYRPVKYLAIVGFGRETDLQWIVYDGHDVGGKWVIDGKILGYEDVRRLEPRHI